MALTAAIRLPIISALGWNPRKSVVTMVISSCWSETCDWQIGMLFIQENYSLIQFAWWEKNLKNGVPEEIHNKRRQ